MKATAAILRYVGVHSIGDRREYGFTLKLDREDEERHFTLVVCDTDFTTKKLSFQEAPDLCYQKLQAELESESDVPVASPLWVTAEDLAVYRERHQSGKAKRRWARPA